MYEGDAETSETTLISLVDCIALPPSICVFSDTAPCGGAAAVDGCCATSAMLSPGAYSVSGTGDLPLPPSTPQNGVHSHRYILGNHKFMYGENIHTCLTHTLGSVVTIQFTIKKPNPLGLALNCAGTGMHAPMCITCA